MTTAPEITPKELEADARADAQAKGRRQRALKGELVSGHRLNATNLEPLDTARHIDALHSPSGHMGQKEHRPVMLLPAHMVEHVETRRGEGLAGDVQCE